MGFCECTVKFALFVFNLLCALLGLVIVGVSVMVNMNGKTFKNVLEGQVTTTTIVLIVIGALVFFIAFFGCCGALREDTCMLTTYAVILTTILLVQVAIGIMAFVYRDKFETSFGKYFEKSFDQYDSDKDSKEFVDNLQREIRCCGVTGPTWWTKERLPGSCCDQTTPDGNNLSCDRNNAYVDGCEPKLESIIKDSLKLLGAVALGIAGVELLCVIFAFCLSSSIKRQERRVYA